MQYYDYLSISEEPTIDFVIEDLDRQQNQSFKSFCERHFKNDLTVIKTDSQDDYFYKVKIPFKNNTKEKIIMLNNFLMKLSKREAFVYRGFCNTDGKLFNKTVAILDDFFVDVNQYTSKIIRKCIIKPYDDDVKAVKIVVHSKKPLTEWGHKNGFELGFNARLDIANKRSDLILFSHVKVLDTKSFEFHIDYTKFFEEETIKEEQKAKILKSLDGLSFEDFQKLLKELNI